jgi:arylsulfatase A-like enzyme
MTIKYLTSLFIAIWLCSGFGQIIFKSKTSKPSHKPSKAPSHKPSKAPSHKPSKAPSNKPTKSPTYQPTEYTPPHLIYMLVDDWGYANWGYHRSDDDLETVTPNMDTLAEEGVVLNNFYAHKNCAPTRAALQTGRFPIHVNVQNVAPTIYNPDDLDTGTAGIPRYMDTIAGKLQGVGYNTHFVGKWDAGMASMEHTPKGRGYNHSLVYYHHDNGYWDFYGGEEDEYLHCFQM